MSRHRQACFYETDPSAPLVRRAAVEGLGTMLLVFAASAGGIAATRLLPGHLGFVVVLVALSVAGTLVSLIIAFGKLSGGHYNPLITALQLLVGERTLRCAVAYIVLQLAGGAVGGALAAALWQAPSTGSGGIGVQGVASEFIASAGLMLVVFGSARSGRPETGPIAVGAWLVSAVIATPTNSYANPAVVIGAMVSAGPIAIGKASVLPYLASEIAGAVLALGIISLIYPKTQTRS